jgi:glycosyltransferase involved in cell wall biosynthesis
MQTTLQDRNLESTTSLETTEKKMIPTISIIVPIYGVEKFIARCARSLFDQTSDSVEYIFVNDCTKDKSMEVLHTIIQEYKKYNLHVKVVSHTENKGLPSARNTGLNIATGEYIFHCDSDDWLEKGAIAQWIDTINRTHADIIWFDYFLSFKENERRFTQKEVETPMDCLKGMLSGSMKYNVWNKISKRQLYTEHQIHFPDGYGMGEDMTIIRLFAYAQTVTYLPKALYHYVQLNQNAYTKTCSEQYLLQIRHNADEILRALSTTLGGRLDKELQFFKLNIKFPFLISNNKESYLRWLEWYPEANRYIDQNLSFSLRARCIQKAAIHHQFWFLRLHYLLFKIKYGVIYK